MSAQLSAVPDTDDHEIPTFGPRAFLPGEAGSAEATRSTDSTADEEPRPAWWRNRRNQLLGGAASAAVLVAIGLVVMGGGSRNTPAAGASGIVPGETIVAPAAKVATVPAGNLPSKAVKPVVTISPKDQQVKEIIGFQQGTAGASPDSSTVEPKLAAPVSAEKGPAVGAAPLPTATQPSNSGNAPADPSAGRPMIASAAGEASDSAKSQPSAGTQETAPVAQAAAAPPAPTAKPATLDPLAVAANIKAADMTQPQQIEVLSLVTTMATLIRDERTEIASLRADQEHTASAVGAKLDDFERRLTLAEAKGAVDSAMGSATHAVTVAAATPIALQAETSPHLIRANTSPDVPTPLATQSAATDGPKRYRVQAASPNLAMLAEIDRSGDDGAQLQISIGDSVPGYGKVTRIAQRGTAWVVQTDHGSIQ